MWTRGRGDAYEILKQKSIVHFMTTSFIRGITLRDAVIIIDECQNMSFQQLKVFLTRTGKYSKVVLCGDVAQVSPSFRDSGLAELIQMIEYFNLDVHTIEFGADDILRSDQCKAWIEAFEGWDDDE